MAEPAGGVKDTTTTTGAYTAPPSPPAAPPAADKPKTPPATASISSGIGNFDTTARAHLREVEDAGRQTNSLSRQMDQIEGRLREIASLKSLNGISLQQRQDLESEESTLNAKEEKLEDTKNIIFDAFVSEYNKLLDEVTQELQRRLGAMTDIGVILEKKDEIIGKLGNDAKAVAIVTEAAFAIALNAHSAEALAQALVQDAWNDKGDKMGKLDIYFTNVQSSQQFRQHRYRIDKMFEFMYQCPEFGKIVIREARNYIDAQLPSRSSATAEDLKVAGSKVLGKLDRRELVRFNGFNVTIQLIIKYAVADIAGISFPRGAQREPKI